MTTKLILLLGVLLGILVSVSSWSKQPVAVVYAGPGVCREGCESAAAEVARHAGFRVRYFHPEKPSSADLKNADVWIQPGGNAIDVANAVTPDFLNYLREFVRRGGGYLGFCAGAFLADKWVNDENTIAGLDILGATTEDYAESDNPFMFLINWSGHLRFLYFQGGPYFHVHDKARTKVVATYDDGKPAVIYSRFGQGRIAVSGPHPEAPESWRKVDSLQDKDGLDYDLALEMLNSLAD